MIKATSITVRRLEGKTWECVSHTYTGDTAWPDAEACLMRASHTAPEQGGYDKCRITIAFAGDEANEPWTYQTRLDLYHPSTGKLERIATHVRREWSFYAGQWTPPHMTKEQHRFFLDRQTLDGTEWARRINLYEIGVTP